MASRIVASVSFSVVTKERAAPAAQLLTVKESAFGRTVARLSAKYELACRVEVRERVPSGAQTVAWRRRIEVEAALLAAPDEVQAQAGAHEFGHLLSARRRGLGFYPWAFFAWVAAAVGLLIAGVWPAPRAVVAMVGPYVAHGLPTVLLVVGVVVLCTALSLESSCLALWRLGRHSRPLEIEADTFAKHEGYPITAAIVDRLRAEEHRG